MGLMGIPNVPGLKFLPQKTVLFSLYLCFDPQCSKLWLLFVYLSSKCLSPFVFALFPLFSLLRMFHTFDSLSPRALTAPCQRLWFELLPEL